MHNTLLKVLVPVYENKKYIAHITLFQQIMRSFSFVCIMKRNVITKSVTVYSSVENMDPGLFKPDPKKRPVTDRIWNKGSIFYILPRGRGE